MKIWVTSMLLLSTSLLCILEVIWACAAKGEPCQNSIDCCPPASVNGKKMYQKCRVRTADVLKQQDAEWTANNGRCEHTANETQFDYVDIGAGSCSRDGQTCDIRKGKILLDCCPGTFCEVKFVGFNSEWNCKFNPGVNTQKQIEQLFARGHFNYDIKQSYLYVDPSLNTTVTNTTVTNTTLATNSTLNMSNSTVIS